MTEVYNSNGIGKQLETIAILRGLQEQGMKVGTLEKETWDRVADLIKKRDMDKLETLREELKTSDTKSLNQSSN